MAEAGVDVNLEMRQRRRKMKWQRGKGMSVGCGGAVIKHSPHLFAFEGFWETIPAICASPHSPQLKVGRYLGLRATSARIADLSPQFVMARRIFTNISANRYGSVITTVQPLLWFFLRDSVFSKLTAVSDPDTM